MRLWGYQERACEYPGLGGGCGGGREGGELEDDGGVVGEQQDGALGTQAAQAARLQADGKVAPLVGRQGGAWALRLAGAGVVRRGRGGGGGRRSGCGVGVACGEGQAGLKPAGSSAR